MVANTREDIIGTFDEAAAVMGRLLDLDFSVLTTPERLAMLARCEGLRRCLPAVEHPLINAVGAQATPAELGGKLGPSLARRLLITNAEARRRVEEAAVLGWRQNLLGQPLPPILPATATAQRDGLIGSGATDVIREFFAHLPEGIDAERAGRAEVQLVEYAKRHAPDEFRRFAVALMDRLNPDGEFSDTDRARRRGIVLGRQGPDGMSRISGEITPEFRATLEPVLAELGGPGMCNPADEQPCTHGTPAQAHIDNDQRAECQRNHDAMLTGLRLGLASGQLGQHNGLPATIIASVDLKDLEAAAGCALTGAGSILPITDVIRLASHAFHWLRIYDGAREVALFHTRRIASPGQRIVLHARDKGCTHPGCGVGGYFCEAHHDQDYAITGVTDIHHLSLRCGCHHDIITTGGWKTRKNSRGQTETIPPPHLDTGQNRINYFWHPDQLLHNDDEDGEDGDEGGAGDEGEEAGGEDP